MQEIQLTTSNAQEQIVPENFDEELEHMKVKVKEMEAEAAKLREMQAQVDKEMNLDSKNEADSRSVYVGNVDYSVTPEEIQAHFSSCGTINRVTILCDKWTGQPKGFAYIEFAEASLVPNAVLLDDSTLKGRQIKVTAKRTNVPTFILRGRGGRGGRGGFRGRAGRGRGGFRGRGRGGYTPY